MNYKAFHPFINKLCPELSKIEYQRTGIPANVPVEFWNIIIPVNVGANYYLSSNKVAPYVGADLLILPGYLRDEYGNANGVATGGRARGGADISITDSMKFNINASLGFWSGQGFSLVQQGFSTSSLVPQISMGTSFAF